MSGELTPEFAKEVRLPLGPFRRNEAVLALLNDPYMTGGIKILIGPDAVPNEVSMNPDISQRDKLAINPMFPLLGRGTLRSVAELLDDICKEGL